MAINADSKIKALLENQDTVAIIDKYLPGFSKDPQIFLCFGMTMRKLVAMPAIKNKVDGEMVAKMLEELDAYGAAN